MIFLGFLLIPVVNIFYIGINLKTTSISSGSIFNNYWLIIFDLFVLVETYFFIWHNLVQGFMENVVKIYFKLIFYCTLELSNTKTSFWNFMFYAHVFFHLALTLNIVRLMRRKSWSDTKPFQIFSSEKHTMYQKKTWCLFYSEILHLHQVFSL